MPLTKIDPAEIKAVLSENRLNSAAVSIHQPDATIEDFIDVVEGNRSVPNQNALGCNAQEPVPRSVYIPAIFVLNKIDAISIEEIDLLYKVNGHPHHRGPKLTSHPDPRLGTDLVQDVAEHR